MPQQQQLGCRYAAAGARKHVNDLSARAVCVSKATWGGKCNVEQHHGSTTTTLRAARVRHGGEHSKAACRPECLEPRLRHLDGDGNNINMETKKAQARLLPRGSPSEVYPIPRQATDYWADGRRAEGACSRDYGRNPPPFTSCSSPVATPMLAQTPD